MLALSDEKLEAIAESCRAYGVKQLDPFGSAATAAFRPGTSESDLLVDFGDVGGRAKAREHLELQDGLRAVRCTDVELVIVAAAYRAMAWDEAREASTLETVPLTSRLGRFCLSEASDLTGVVRTIRL